MQLQIDELEQELMIEVISIEIEELKEEIHHTDDYDFKEKLKQKMHILENLLSKLKK